MYVFGGEQNQGTFDNNKRYDVATDTWSEELPMPTARHGLVSLHMTIKYMQ